MRREMDRFSSGCPRLWPVLLPLLLALAAVASPADAAIDYGVNQTVWKMLYGVTDAQINDPAWLARDDDGDGLSNGAELAAGTDPFNPASAMAITSMTPGAGGVSFTFPTVAGKQYVLQSNPDVTDPAGWTAIAAVAPLGGTGSPGTLTAPAPDPGAASLFYRVAVQDADTDGDGLSDWAEKVTGFDPATANTHGAAVDDHTALTNDLASENVVTVTATKATATQPANAATDATDTATITVTRGGTLHFSTITVPLSWTGTASSGTDYAPLPTSVTFPPKVGSITLTIVPMANPNRRTGATITLAARPGGGYTVGAAHAASAVISPAGNTTGTGLMGYYYNAASNTVAPYSNAAAVFAKTPTATRLDATVDYVWSSSTLPAGIATTYFLARWKGQVQPQYSETYYFDVTADDGVDLWVNGQLILSSWSYTGTGDRLGSIALQAGVLYDIQLDYYQAINSTYTHLSWYSNSQPKQIIPSTRLYPPDVVPAPPAITSAPQAFGFVNQPFTFNVTASASGGSAAAFALGAGSGPLPPGLTLNAATGVISGTPTAAGDYQVALTASNSQGVGASVLDIQILNPGSGVTRELWNNLAGPNVSDLPLATAPDSIDTTLTTPEDNAATYGSNTGERLRGYFTAPVTGNYHFWLAAGNAAELWVSDDNQAANLIRRAWVTAPGTGAESWNDANQTHQRTPWLALNAGQNYYYEVRHNTGGSPGSNNLAVAWTQDASGTATSPTAPATGGSVVVPGYVLSRYDYPTTTAAAGALYVSDLSPQGVATSTATGSANLRLLPGNAQAILHFNYGGLSSPRTAYHLHIAPDQTGSGPIVFDLDDVDKFHPELKTADGGYLWNIVGAGAYSAAQIVAALQGGTIYFNVHTVNYPNGEIRGFLTLVNGSQKAPTPVPDPGYGDDHATDAGAARFLGQAAYGASPADLAAVQSGGYAAWIDNQMSTATTPATSLLTDVQAGMAAATVTYKPATIYDNSWWRAAITGNDQLRQRVAFALTETFVVSDTSFSTSPDALAAYNDMLAANAFGNFRDLLKTATLHPVMGLWLNMQGNQKGNLATGYHPNENYAREIMQLFSIGLNRLWPDGTLVLDASGDLVPTYNQGTITNGFARVFTGWTWHQALQSSGQLPTGFSPATNLFDPMTLVKNYHELGPKTLLDNVVLPPAAGYNPPAAVTGGSQADTTTAAYDAYCLQDLEQALDNIFYHPNVGPFICRQLIQRLVESNPSPAYLYRVVAKFNDDGTSAHVRGNMAAVIRAILLDGEARDAAAAAVAPTSGKQREPLLRITGPCRTFPFAANGGSYDQAGTGVMTITTNTAHHFTAGDVAWLDFSGNATGAPPVVPANNPTTTGYTVASVPSATTLTVNVTNVTAAGYTHAASTNTLTVATAGPVAGDTVYLKFLTDTTNASNVVASPFQDGVYTVVGNPTTGSFTVNPATISGGTPTSDTRGTLLVPRTTALYTTTLPAGATANTITVATNTDANLNAGDRVRLVGPSTYAAGSMANAELPDTVWTIASVIDNRHFTVSNTYGSYRLEHDVTVTMYPLAAPILSRHGSVALPAGKFDMGNTNAYLAQTPLNAATVFNFFAPDYEYPGTLAANNVTTPEFELTTDSNVITLTNTIASTILSSGNTNGISNFRSGAINLDLSAYLGAPYFNVTTGTSTTGTKVTLTTTTNVNADALINKLGDLLTGGMLSSPSKATIKGFITNTTNFPAVVQTTATTPAVPASPTTARDIVRAVVHAIIVSPEYAVQR